MTLPYHDRRDAGKQLAARLHAYANRPDVLVLGLPRGGVPVAFEVAEALGAPLDIYLVRKLGVPGHEELAMGAIATGGVRVLNREVMSELHLPDEALEVVTARELAELERRERLYRGDRPPPAVQGKTVILVDDGLATGSTMRAAVASLRQQTPARIVGAVPVAAPAVCRELQGVVDEMVCALTPETFYAVGLWYEDFRPTTDKDVQSLLRRAEARQPSGPSPPKGNGAASTTDPAPSVPLPALIRNAVHPVDADAGRYDPLLKLIGDARFVLLGEASHGTHEFYQERAEITKRLIREKGFTAVAVEADWPDAYRVNCFVRGANADATADAALGDFRRFPQWMWRNEVVRDFVDWLRLHNDEQTAASRKTGFYGLDLYSLHASIEAVITYLDAVDPEAAARARRRYSCFDHFGDDAQLYGYATSLGAAEPCEDEVVTQLLELQRRAAELASRDGRIAEDNLFHAEQNARLARNAEAYYRSMFRGRVSSWNLRDRHMAETLEELVAHLERRGGRTKVVVWAHNSHLGDARATQMGGEGELNLGQLVRERHGDDSRLIGFSTYAGTVTAASEWGGPAERKRVRPGLPGSYEALFHEMVIPRFTLPLRGGGVVAERLREPRLQRAIGVIYRPETERLSHYFDARLADQFDAVIHLDETSAVAPLESTAEWTAGELPETYPSAL
jgi:erythromycin esterase-like protein/predicted phosphoribosyltransferase